MTQIQPPFSYATILYHQFGFSDSVELTVEEMDPRIGRFFCGHWVATREANPTDTHLSARIINNYRVNPFTGELFIEGPDVRHFSSPPIRPIRRVIE